MLSTGVLAPDTLIPPPAGALAQDRSLPLPPSSSQRASSSGFLLFVAQLPVHDILQNPATVFPLSRND